jgi:hypothetical protein
MNLSELDHFEVSLESILPYRLIQRYDWSRERFIHRQHRNAKGPCPLSLSFLLKFTKHDYDSFTFLNWIIINSRYLYL